MSYALSEVTSATEFGAIMPMHFQAFRTPYNTFSKFFTPIHTTIDAAIEAAKVRNIKLWQSNPACHFIKVVETDSGDVVGAACWLIDEKGYANDGEKKRFNAYWHIEGSVEKAFAERLIGGLRGFVAERMTRPHVELNGVSVHPKHWRSGVGRMMLDWGTERADELGVGTCVVSVPFAVSFYERCGFGRIEQIDIDFTMPDPSEKWNE